MKNNIAKIFLALFVSVFLLNCEDTFVPDTDYITFESTSVEFGVDPEGTGTQDFKIFATEVSSSERTFGIAVVADGTDATNYTVPTSVTMPANSNVGTFTVTASGPDIDPANGNKIEVEITNPDGSLFGESMTINLKQVCPYPELFIAMTFDAYPEEQYWGVYDMNGNLLFQGGTYPGETSLTEKVCLAPGTYQFLMADSWGDGGGAYTLTHNGVILHSSDGNYGSGEVTVITLP